MTKTQIDAIQILSRCTFAPATTAKRFVRDMSTKSSDYELSDKQKSYLWKLVYQYRGQHKNKWFTAHAENMMKGKI